MHEAELAKLRANIDQTDDQIIRLLAVRFAATKEVGKLKASAGLAAVDEVRELQQQRRYRHLAEMNGLNPDLVLHVFRSIIEEVVTNHRAISTSPPK